MATTPAPLFGQGQQSRQPSPREKDLVAPLETYSVAAAAKMRITIDPMSGEQVATIINHTINAPSDLIAKAIAA